MLRCARLCDCTPQAEIADVGMLQLFVEHKQYFARMNLCIFCLHIHIHIHIYTYSAGSIQSLTCANTDHPPPLMNYIHSAAL